eukprot:scaffold527354_cov14-Prasinocladus_malaysianus.AAC.1
MAGVYSYANGGPRSTVHHTIDRCWMLDVGRWPPVCSVTSNSKVQIDQPQKIALLVLVRVRVAATTRRTHRSSPALLRYLLPTTTCTRYQHVRLRKVLIQTTIH